MLVEDGTSTRTLSLFAKLQDAAIILRVEDLKSDLT